MPRRFRHGTQVSAGSGFQRDDCRLLFVNLLSVGIVAFLTFVGCQRDETTSTPTSIESSTTGLAEMTQRFVLYAADPDPTKRMRVLSEPATDRRDWAMQTLLRGYRETGRTNAYWDEAMRRAFEAFCDYTRVSLDNWSKLRQALDVDLATDCDDPMLGYMRVRYRAETLPPEVTAVDYLQAALGMAQSDYHPIFKFMAGLRAMQSVQVVDFEGASTALPDWTMVQMEDLARDTNAPVEDVFECAGYLMDYNRLKQWFSYVASHLEPVLQTNWGSSEQWYSFEGALEVRRAWAERGDGYANTVTDEGWEGFRKHLALAEEALTTAWSMDTNDLQTAYWMMRLELGRGRGRDRMETWFNRAVALDPNFFDAVSYMAFYLEPRWYGSEQQTLTFARSCVSSEKWGGRVPLILADVHRSLAGYYGLANSPEYWHRPVVQRDVQASYERFFELNPKEVSWRHNYAKDAFQCGLYQVFLDQLPLFTGGTNYSFFGGEARFSEMVSEALETVADKEEQ